MYTTARYNTYRYSDLPNKMTTRILKIDEMLDASLNHPIIFFYTTGKAGHEIATKTH